MCNSGDGAWRSSGGTWEACEAVQTTAKLATMHFSAFSEGGRTIRPWQH